MYESRPRAVIISLNNSLYRIPEVAPPTATSLITTKKGSKLISQTRKFICLVHSQSKGKIVATSMTPAKGSSMQQQQQRDTVMTKHRNNFSSPTWVPHKFQVGNKVWLHRQKERLTRTHQKLRSFRHGLYSSIKAMGNNALEHIIPSPAPNVQCGPSSTMLPTITGHIRDCRTSSADGGAQRNGDHCFLRGEE